MSPVPEVKRCAACGRSMEFRRKWARTWDTVRYCSERCRRHKPSALDRMLEEALVQLLDERPSSATVCPSEVARRVRPKTWRPLLKRVRSAARRLEARGHVEIRQRGQRVDPSTAKGPIRIARARFRHE